MKIYIAGPISGHDDYMEKFAAAEEKLKKEEVEDMVQVQVKTVELDTKDKDHVQVVELVSVLKEDKLLSSEELLREDLLTILLKNMQSLTLVIQNH